MICFVDGERLPNDEDILNVTVVDGVPYISMQSSLDPANHQLLPHEKARSPRDIPLLEEEQKQDESMGNIR